MIAVRGADAQSAGTGGAAQAGEGGYHVVAQGPTTRPELARSRGPAGDTTAAVRRESDLRCAVVPCTSITPLHQIRFGSPSKSSLPWQEGLSIV
jgi:hypothetical protein